MFKTTIAAAALFAITGAAQAQCVPGTSDLASPQCWAPSGTRDLYAPIPRRPQPPSYTINGPNGVTFVNPDGAGGYTANGPAGVTFYTPNGMGGWTANGPDGVTFINPQ